LAATLRRFLGLVASVLSREFVDKVPMLEVRHTRESGYPEVFEIPGFRVALAIASLPGMTSELGSGFQKQDTRVRSSL
jgi:hypothetical protein